MIVLFCLLDRNDWWDSLNSWWHNIWWVHNYSHSEKKFTWLCHLLSDEESWNDVIIACSSLVPKWKQLSGFIGLSHKTIHAINGNNPGDKEGAWNDALMQWILQDYNTEKHGLPSWRTLLKTIGRVDQPLFEKLAKEHQAKGRGVLVYTRVSSTYDHQCSIKSLYTRALKTLSF